jgi:hypothetical protein
MNGTLHRIVTAPWKAWLSKQLRHSILDGASQPVVLHYSRFCHARGGNASLSSFQTFWLRT